MVASAASIARSRPALALLLVISSGILLATVFAGRPDAQCLSARSPTYTRIPDLHGAVADEPSAFLGKIVTVRGVVSARFQPPAAAGAPRVASHLDLSGFVLQARPEAPEVHYSALAAPLAIRVTEGCAAGTNRPDCVTVAPGDDVEVEGVVEERFTAGGRATTLRATRITPCARCPRNRGATPTSSSSSPSSSPSVDRLLGAPLEIGSALEGALLLAEDDAFGHLDFGADQVMDVFWAGLESTRVAVARRLVVVDDSRLKTSGEVAVRLAAADGSDQLTGPALALVPFATGQPSTFTAREALPVGSELPSLPEAVPMWTCRRCSAAAAAAANETDDDLFGALQSSASAKTEAEEEGQGDAAADDDAADLREDCGWRLVYTGSSPLRFRAPGSHEIAVAAAEAGVMQRLATNALTTIKALPVVRRRRLTQSGKATSGKPGRAPRPDKDDNDNKDDDKDEEVEFAPPDTPDAPRTPPAPPTPPPKAPRAPRAPRFEDYGLKTIWCEKAGRCDQMKKQPVCGTNNRLYDNWCHLTCAKDPIEAQAGVVVCRGRFVVSEDTDCAEWNKYSKTPECAADPTTSQ